MSQGSVFHFGADYYPEQWPEGRWPVDAQLMEEAGLNVVRLAEFAWSKLEPRPGVFDFDWLDRLLEILQAHGISAVLGTPTASPPPWLMNAHPDIFRMREDGHRISYGNRCEYCPNNPNYRKHIRGIVTAMAEHFAAHPAVIGWQIDNEMGERCYCLACQEKFQAWLSDHYRSLENLNAAWGTQFWSHVYSDWREIPVPLSTGGSPNPGLALDYRRFISDTYVDYQQMQVDILRQNCPGHFITHNFMGYGYEGLDYYNLSRSLDFVSWDNYPLGFWQKECPNAEAEFLALSHDAMRGLKRCNFWVMEQQAGPSGWETVSPSPRPGQLRLWAYQAIAHGADGVVFFRWRTARYGTEQYWHGLLDHHGQPGRRYAEIKQMGAELKKVGAIVRGSRISAEVAILSSYDSRFAFQVQQNNYQFNYTEHVTHIYKAIFRLHVSMDIVSPEADFSAYRLVVVPALHILEEPVADKLRLFVQKGGTLVITPRTGVKDTANTVVEQPLPGLLAELCGVHVSESDSLYDTKAGGPFQSVKFTLPALQGIDPPAARIWCDILEPAGARVIAEYTSDYYSGKPAITVQKFGQGRAIYVGTFGDLALYQALFDWLIPELKIRSMMAESSVVEITERWQAGRRLLFILNHSATPQPITVPNGINLIDNKRYSGSILTAPHDVIIIDELK